MKYILLALSICAFPFVSAQNRISLKECQQKAQDNYPLIKQYDLIAKTKDYTLSNIGKTYLPQFSVNGQATYQSDVTKFPLDLSTLGLPLSIDPLSKDQYKATIDVSQVIWDGGSTKAMKNVTEAKSEVDKQQITTNLYKIKEQINQLYFGVLAINEQIELLNTLEEDLNANKKIMQSMFNNGTLSQSDLDLIEVELLNVSQNKIEQEKIKDGFLQMLSLYTSDVIETNTIFEIPLKNKTVHSDMDRPELKYYEAQRIANKTQLEAISAKNTPTIGLFVQGGYGKPGLNMLEDKFKLFAIGGVKVSWNLGNLYTKKNEKQQIKLNKNMIDVQEEVFLFNTKLQMTQQDSETKKLEAQLEKDNEIINLYGRVKKASESKYKNGVYQTNDLLRDINAENRAKQTRALREIQHLQSIYNKYFLQGY